MTIFLDENLTSQVKNVSSSRTVVLNKIQWFILVTFKDHIPQDVKHELGDSCHTLDLHCRICIHITSDDNHVLFNKSQGAYLMELACSCIYRQITKVFKLHDKRIQWRNKCLQTQSFCTPPNTSVIDFEKLCDEKMYKTIN